MTKTKARHSKDTVRWGTHEDIVDRARISMGGVITLDPCSEERFNQVIRAQTYYSLLERGEDGLKLPWFGSVLCNPPGGLIREFWEKTLSEDIDQAVWVGFSVEQLGLLADASAHPSDFAICYLRKRIKFTRHDGYSGSPSHSNYVVGLNINRALFLEQFAPLGKVQFGPLAL